MIGVSRGYSITKGMENAREEILDRGYTYHVLGDYRWSGPEDAGDLPDSFVLGGLERVDETFLRDPRVPYWYAIR